MTKKIKHCDKELEKDVKNMKKSGRTHNKESTEVDNVAMLRLEDLFVRSIFEQSGGFIHVTIISDCVFVFLLLTDRMNCFAEPQSCEKGAGKPRG